MLSALRGLLWFWKVVWKMVWKMGMPTESLVDEPLQTITAAAWHDSFSRKKTQILPKSPVSCISLPISLEEGTAPKKITVKVKPHFLSLIWQRIILLHPEMMGFFWHGVAEDEAGGYGAGGWVHGGRAWQWKGMDSLCWDSSRRMLLTAQ